MTRKNYKGLLTTCGVAWLGLGLAHASLAQYNVIDLGSFGGDSQAFGINASGSVTGSSGTGGRDLANNAATAAFLYNGSLNQLGTLGGVSSVGLGINSSGQVVGYSQLTNSTTLRAFLSSGTGPLTNLGTLAGGVGDTNQSNNSQANGINNAGEVVGSSSATGQASGSTVNHAFLYSSGALTDLGTLLGGTTSTANGIDSLGRIVGSSNTITSSITHAFVWVPPIPNTAVGTMVDLGALGGAFSNAFAINTVGQIAGQFTTGTGSIHAFRTTTPLTPINPLTDDLGTLGGTYSQAAAINASGTTVGLSATAAGGFDAFIFTTGSTQMTDLNTLLSPVSGAGWTLIAAEGINDSGQIVGYGTHNGLTRAFLLTPAAAPEPSSLAVLGLGAAATVVLAARRRRRASAA